MMYFVVLIKNFKLIYLKMLPKCEIEGAKHVERFVNHILCWFMRNNSQFSPILPSPFLLQME